MTDQPKMKKIYDDIFLKFPIDPAIRNRPQESFRQPMSRP
jgi:hypothetical protein